MEMLKRYSELITFPTFEERLNYLRLSNQVGYETFGFDRYLNQNLYHSDIWKRLRNEIILRDNGCDLAIDGFTIFGKVIIHHLNPLTKDDIILGSSKVLDPENLVCVSYDTHNAIHYGSEPRSYSFVERKENDTCLW